jgi:NTE family protein
MDISIALGGGGAKGNSHIGVLRRLEKEGYKIRAVAGTSFGGIVAVFYAAGYSPDEIEDIFGRVDQGRLYFRENGSAPSLLGNGGIRIWLNETLGDKTFDDLKIPCAVTAVDMNQPREIILSEGRLQDAILATIALPAIFPAQMMNGMELVDGGVLDPVPVSVARMLAPKLPVVAVVLTAQLGDPLNSIIVPMPRILPRPIASRIAQMRFAQVFEVFMQSLDITTRHMTQLRLELDNPEAVIRPRVNHIGVLDKVDVHEVAMLGEQAVEESLPEIKRALAWNRRLLRAIKRAV